jgi:hypothetical protein
MGHITVGETRLGKISFQGGVSSLNGRPEWWAAARHASVRHAVTFVAVSWMLVGSTSIALSQGFELPPSSTAYSFSGLTIYDQNGEGGYLDIGQGGIVVPENSIFYENSSGEMFSGLPAVQAMLSAGYDGGAWNGLGIDSSAAAQDQDGYTAVGYIDNNVTKYSTWRGVSLNTATDSNGNLLDPQVLISYTYYGDALLQGTVTASDLAISESSYNKVQSGQSVAATWANGDFTYDPVIGLGDYEACLNGYDAVQDGLLPNLNFGVVSAVPEPGALALLGADAVGLVGFAWRRRGQAANAPLAMPVP